MKIPHIGFHETMSGYYLDLFNSNLACGCECSEGCCSGAVMIPTNLQELSDFKEQLPNLEKKFEFTVTASAPLHRFANSRDSQFMLTKLEGVVTMEGVCENAEISNGELLLDFFTDNQLVYEFDFKVRNRNFHYEGAKDLNLLHPVYSMTTLNGQINETDENLRRKVYLSECKFELAPKNLAKFLWSFAQNLKLK